MRAFERADELFIEAPNSYDDKENWPKNQNYRLEPIWHVRPILASAVVDIVDSRISEVEDTTLRPRTDFSSTDPLEAKTKDTIFLHYGWQIFNIF